MPNRWCRVLPLVLFTLAACGSQAKPTGPGQPACAARCAAKVATCSPADNGGNGGVGVAGGGDNATPAQCALTCTHLYQVCGVAIPDANGNPVSEQDCERDCPSMLDPASATCFGASDCSDSSLDGCFASAPPSMTMGNRPPAAANPMCDELCGGDPAPAVLDCLDGLSCDALPAAMADHTCDVPDTNPPDMNPPDMNPPDRDPPQMPVACAVPKGSLHSGVSFPFYSTAPATVLEAGGTCYHSVNGVVSEGWNNASALDVLADATTGTPTVLDHSHVLYTIDFALAQRKPTSTELATLSSRTGVPVSAITVGQSEQIIETTQTKPTTLGYTLPAGVTLNAFLGSSLSAPGSIQFQATSADRSKLDQVLIDLRSGISVRLDIGRFAGSNHSTYTVKLKVGGSPQVAVTAITP